MRLLPDTEQLRLLMLAEEGIRINFTAAEVIIKHAIDDGFLRRACRLL